MTQVAPHIPVLLDEVMAALTLGDGDIYVDGTFGAGGYTRAALAAGRIGRTWSAAWAARATRSDGTFRSMVRPR